MNPTIEAIQVIIVPKIGIGEKLEDLRDFNAGNFIEALFEDWYEISWTIWKNIINIIVGIKLRKFYMKNSG